VVGWLKKSKQVETVKARQYKSKKRQEETKDKIHTEIQINR
jgi:hypothetical protein